MKLKYIISYILISCFVFADNFKTSSKSDLLKFPLIVMPYIDNEEQLLNDELNNIPGPIKFSERTTVYP